MFHGWVGNTIKAAANGVLLLYVALVFPEGRKPKKSVAPSQQLLREHQCFEWAI